MSRDLGAEVRVGCPRCKAVAGMACVEGWKPDPGGTQQWRPIAETHPSRIEAARG